MTDVLLVTGLLSARLLPSHRIRRASSGFLPQFWIKVSVLRPEDKNYEPAWASAPQYVESFVT